jgi:hypothetical protein
MSCSLPPGLEVYSVVKAVQASSIVAEGGAAGVAGGGAAPGLARIAPGGAKIVLDKTNS